MRWSACLVAGLLAVPVMAAEAPSPTPPPDNAGPLKLVSASYVGAKTDDELVAAAVAEDGSVLLAGNSLMANYQGLVPVALGEPGEGSGAARANDKRDPFAAGFVIRLAPDGQRVTGYWRVPNGAYVERMQLDGKGNVHLLGDAAAPVRLKGADGTGKFLLAFSPADGHVLSSAFRAGAIDFGLDPNGDTVVLANGKMSRHAPDGRERWTVGWKTHGGNRPGGMAVSPTTGIAAVVGYGMTHTGKEPYKDPYAYAFDREGKQVWMLWNPDPKKEVAANFGGNGLMADTTGVEAEASPDGDLYFILRADGGNSVCTRDPLDVDRKLDPAVHEGVFQKGPGHGFKGASSTCAVFRADAKTGKLEKGTWMCAWLTPQRANGLSMRHVAADAKGRQFVVGSSASGCPTKLPWYVAPEGGYKGGGFLACFDAGFALAQAGYFPGTDLRAVAVRGDTVVIAGSAVEVNVAKDPAEANAAERTYPVPRFQSIQREFAGGKRDGWFAILKVNG